MNCAPPQGSMSRAQRVELKQRQQHGSRRREGPRLATALSLGMLAICCGSNTAVNAFVSPATSALSTGLAVQQRQWNLQRRTGFSSGTAVGVLSLYNRMKCSSATRGGTRRRTFVYSSSSSSFAAVVAVAVAATVSCGGRNYVEGTEGTDP